jgi:hypothetical protein
MTQNTITMRVALNGTVTGKIEGFEFGAQVYSEPSIDGIHQGRVSRLSICKGQEVLLHYDQGWNVPVPDHCRTVYEKLVKALEALPA